MSNTPDVVQVLARAKRPIEIDDVDPTGAVGHEPFRDRERIIAVNGLPRRFALAQANDAAMSNVDGWEEVHYRNATGATGPGFPAAAKGPGRQRRANRGAAA